MSSNVREHDGLGVRVTDSGVVGSSYSNIHELSYPKRKATVPPKATRYTRSSLVDEK